MTDDRYFICRICRAVLAPRSRSLVEFVADLRLIGPHKRPQPAARYVHRAFGAWYQGQAADGREDAPPQEAEEGGKNVSG